MIAAACLAFGGCRGERSLVVVGCKGSTEQLVLGHIVAQLLESRPRLRVVRKLNLGDTGTCFSALERGEIDVYPEYTGTMLTVILKQRASRRTQYTRTRARNLLADRYHVRCLSPLGFSHTYVLMMRPSDAATLGVKTISDLRRHAKTVKAAFTPEFLTRPDGYRGFVEWYGFELATRPLQMASGELSRALLDARVSVVSGYSTDGCLNSRAVTILKDNRGFFTPYQACLLVRQDALDRVPELSVLLDQLSDSINDATVRWMNAEVDIRHRSPSAVAADFLHLHGLVP